MGRPETELRGKDLTTKPPQIDDALQRVLFMIRHPGGPTWPKRLRLKNLSAKRNSYRMDEENKKGTVNPGARWS